MNVLVTGGSGAIGQFVVEELLKRGHDVTILDVSDPPDHTETEFIRGSVTDENLISKVVEDTDTVVHLAGLIVPACTKEPPRGEAVNVGGTLAVLEAASEQDVRVIYASSKGAFGPITGEYGHPTYEPIGTDAPKNPQTVYGITKLSGERYCQHYSKEHNLDVAAFRFASTYGPGKGEQHGSLAIISQMVNHAVSGTPLSLQGGDQLDDFVYYADLAEGLSNAVETDELSYRTYHLGSNHLASIDSFAEALLEFFPDWDIEISGGLNFYEYPIPTYGLLDISRARTDLDYEPKFQPCQGIQDYMSRTEFGTPT